MSIWKRKDMTRTKNYVDMLVNSLDKKYNTLLSIEKLEIKQEEAILNKKITPEELEEKTEEQTSEENQEETVEDTCENIEG